jgi:hypothetical protein
MKYLANSHVADVRPLPLSFTRTYKVGFRVVSLVHFFTTSTDESPSRSPLVMETRARSERNDLFQEVRLWCPYDLLHTDLA